VSPRRPGAARALGRRLLGEFAHGEWRPGAHNVALLVVQLITLYQAGLRGRDYLIPRTTGAIDAQGLGIVEAAAALPVWGWLFYLSTVLAVVGLAGRWAPVVIAGHALLWAWYSGIGYGVLADQGITLTWRLIGGAMLATLGLWVIFRRNAPGAPVRLLIGVPAMLVGQELMSTGLGQDYRSGTGLMGAGAIHATLAVGTWLLAKRERLRTQVEGEFGVRLPR
jgi:hypothetical protein